MPPPSQRQGTRRRLSEDEEDGESLRPAPTRRLVARAPAAASAAAAGTPARPAQQQQQQQQRSGGRAAAGAAAAAAASTAAAGSDREDGADADATQAGVSAVPGLSWFAQFMQVLMSSSVMPADKARHLLVRLNAPEGMRSLGEDMLNYALAKLRPVWLELKVETSRMDGKEYVAVVDTYTGSLLETSDALHGTKYTKHELLAVKSMLLALTKSRLDAHGEWMTVVALLDAIKLPTGLTRARVMNRLIPELVSDQWLTSANAGKSVALGIRAQLELNNFLELVAREGEAEEADDKTPPAS